MCMATLIPANVEVPWEGLKNGSITNKDGHGFAIASALGIETFKSMKYQETEDALKVAREKHGMDSIVLFHSRYGTHGEMGEYNVHPFIVEEDEDGNVITVMAHNGVLPAVYHPDRGTPEKRSNGHYDKEQKKHIPGEIIQERIPGDRRSDTRIFVDTEAGDFCATPLGVPSRSGGKKLGKIIGTGNKLIFLSIKGGQPKARIINSHMGDFVKGVWFSNSGYKFGCGGTRKWSGTTSTSSRPSYSNDWWGDDEYSVGHQAYQARSGSSYPPRVTQQNSLFNLEEGYAKCSNCMEFGVDTITNICSECDFCLDCDTKFTDCQCYYAGSSTGTPKEEDRDGAIQDKLYEAWCNKEISDEEYERGFANLYPQKQEVEPDPVIPVLGEVVDGNVQVNGVWVPIDSLVENMPMG